jgi:hypothetical protein
MGVVGIGIKAPGVATLKATGKGWIVLPDRIRCLRVEACDRAIHVAKSCAPKDAKRKDRDCEYGN